MLALEARFVLDRGDDEEELRACLSKQQRDPMVKWLITDANADLAPLAGRIVRAYRGETDRAKRSGAARLLALRSTASSLRHAGPDCGIMVRRHAPLWGSRADTIPAVQCSAPGFVAFG